MSLKHLTGQDIANRITEGRIKKITPDVLKQVREFVSDACEELLLTGARVRPLLVGDAQIGWVRGVHPSERRLLAHWYPDGGTDFVEAILTLGTTLTREELAAMSGREIISLAKLVKQMTDHDISLVPYVSAFATTYRSEQLWNSKQRALSDYGTKTVGLPDGKALRLIAPPNHANLWAYLCAARDLNRSRLEASMNAAMIVRPWVGKGADGYIHELRTALRNLQPDKDTAWLQIVKTSKTVNVDDGWGHPDDSEAGLLRELHGMVSGDLHEQVMDAFMKQQLDAAEDEKARVAALVERRGGPGVEQTERFVMTPKQMKERQDALRKGKPVPRDTEVAPSPAERIKRYK